jgi:hypothetical protein
VDVAAATVAKPSRPYGPTTVSTEYLFALVSCAIGMALLVVSLAFPPEHRVVRVKREPIYVRVAESPWGVLPEATMAGRGRPIEP